MGCLRLANCIAFALNLFCTFGISYLGEFGYGKKNVEISARYPTILTPPWFAFPVVWLPIFILEAVFVLWQLCQPLTNVYVHRGISWWFVAACLFQSAWNLTFAKEKMVVSAVLMVIVTKCLHIAILRMTVIDYKEGVPGKGCCGVTSIWLPFGLHAAWTLWAACINVMVCLTYYELRSSIQMAVAIAFLAYAFGVNAAFTVISRNLWYGLTAAWALFCIAQNQLYTDMLMHVRVGDAMQYACLALSALMVLFSLLGATPLRRLYVWLLFCLIGNPKDTLPAIYISPEYSALQGSEPPPTNYRAATVS
mmetsp:Transcript_5082/g.7015  ORF Transcript_5082/g.7015 Transcript_5082/m.7015 type:complete len:308 (+) Transcript_5082:91-1014(+)